MLPIRCHGWPAVASGVGPRIYPFDRFRQRRQHTLQVRRDWFARGPVSFAPLPAHGFPRLGQESQDRRVALLPPVLGMISLARTHLSAVHRRHRRVGVQRDSRNCKWCRRAQPTYNARIIPRTNRNPGIDVVRRLIVTCSSMRCWNCSFSSIVAPGNNPP